MNQILKSTALKARLVGDYWVILLVLTIGKDTFRYTDLKKNLEQNHGDIVSSRTLTQRLEFLQNERILERIVTSHKPPVKVSYRLTKFGHNLLQFLADLEKLKI